MIERDGYRFIIPAVLVAGALWTLFACCKCWPYAVGGVLITILAVFIVYFFRDPQRTPPVGDNLVLSPGDGKIIINEERTGSDGKKYTLVSIFLSVFDVHVNRIPISGKITHVKHVPGKFHKAFQPEAVTENERTEITVASKYGDVSFSQVAGILARRIVCRIKEGDEVTRGERMGLIRFGSRIDIFLPPSVTIDVKLGDRVVGGESVIGRFP
ncbi:MAG: phosphatidylserine decarboxylase family protein [bacterium]|nr:phosphatidylserine decarboxylase family protein [bacterium]